MLQGNTLLLIPGKGLLNVKHLQIQLMDITGKILLSETANMAPQIQLKLPQLAKGIYIVKTEAGNRAFSARLSL
jgi:hypothetical protein